MFLKAIQRLASRRRNKNGVKIRPAHLVKLLRFVAKRHVSGVSLEKAK